MKRTMSWITLAAVAMMLAGTAFAQESTPSAQSAPTEKPKMEGKTHHMKKGAHRMVYDLNAASKEDLMKLPGLDDATVDKIIAARPFTASKELVSKSILTEEQYAKVRSMVKVKSAKMSKGAKAEKSEQGEKTEGK
jgi:DNA uptake protein ComE-like DNA-binding protein